MIAISAILCALLLQPISAQEFGRFKPGEIRQKLERLNVLGSVLYVAAHPDDENTRLIAYYANEELMRTGYLAATRGDGGQNLIGPEIREGLGVIRTQELLGARRTDGGQQFFSRANDFGYSKTPEETFTIWDREEVLADFVWVFRKFRPDIVITRFDSDGVSHGHHTASAILAREAFKMAGDAKAFPEQLAYVSVWQPKKIFWNTGRWWFRNEADTAGLAKISVGGYNPLLGQSYGEIAAKSRSMHKSQGFGSSGSRGDEVEYLKQWGGNVAASPFADIDTSWDRVEGAKEVAFLINKAIEEYDERRPWEIMESLVLARRALSNIDDVFWKNVKQKEIDELIIGISGLYFSLNATMDSYTPGDSITIVVEAVNRSPVDIRLSQIKFNPWINPITFKTALLNNKPFSADLNFQLPTNTPYSHPYWLVEQSQLGMYTVNDQESIGMPENNPPIYGEVTIDVGGELINFQLPVKYKRTDPVDGEVITPITIGPPVMMNVDVGVLVFGDESSKQVEVRVIAGKNNVEGDLSLELPKGWNASPKNQSFRLTRKGEEQMYSFSITPSKKSSVGVVKSVAKVDGRSYSKGRTIIDYDHIPKQTLYPESNVKVVKLDLVKKGNRIGYIQGAGDAIPENLRQVGYQVEELEKDDIDLNNLEKYDAVILGVRAFNTVDWLGYKNKELFEYVKNGGNVIVQYNTNRGLVTNEIAPYKLVLSRDRVAVEDAPVTILAEDHPLIKGPNKIKAEDFDNWVQERGLYFADDWADEFTPLFSSNDPGESPKNGGLLVAKYGEGYYIYSGYSWFRELPAGVPGAYRIFVNMISIGK